LEKRSGTAGEAVSHSHVIKKQAGGEEALEERRIFITYHENLKLVEKNLRKNSVGQGNSAKSGRLRKLCRESETTTPAIASNK